MKYTIKFQEITSDKPTNLTFQIRGTDVSCSTLAELEKYLVGRMDKKAKKEIIIDWQWVYEFGESESAILANDMIDTNDGKNLQSYQFKIIVTGEEVV